MFGFLRRLFGGKSGAPEAKKQGHKEAPAAPQATPATTSPPAPKNLPDGEYIVTLKDEQAEPDQYVQVNFKVTRGPFAGAVVSMKFSDDAAKKVTHEDTESYLAFLAFENHQQAYELVESIDYSREDTDGEFIVLVEAGAVSSTPPYNAGQVAERIAAA